MKRKPGRPTLYQDHFAQEAHQIALLGLTDAEMAQHFDVAGDTIAEWKKVHPEFSEALKRGKVVADTNVADSLYQRAQGYEWDEEVPIKVKEVIYENGKRVRETETVVMKTVHRVVPPDTTACIFWLKNRKPDQWREKVEHAWTGDPSKWTDEELAQRRRALMKVS